MNREEQARTDQDSPENIENKADTDSVFQKARHREVSFSGSSVPSYVRDTVSNQCRRESSRMKVQTPLPNIGDSFDEHLRAPSDISDSMDGDHIPDESRVSCVLFF